MATSSAAALGSIVTSAAWALATKGTTMAGADVTELQAAIDKHALGIDEPSHGCWSCEGNGALPGSLVEADSEWPDGAATS